MSERVLATQLTTRGEWELVKAGSVFEIRLNGGAWIVTERCDRAYDAFNDLVQR